MHEAENVGKSKETKTSKSDAPKSPQDIEKEIKQAQDDLRELKEVAGDVVGGPSRQKRGVDSTNMSIGKIMRKLQELANRGERTCR